MTALEGYSYNGKHFLGINETNIAHIYSSIYVGAKCSQKINTLLT